ncbi:MAG: serine/threonine protein kinase, partial [Thermoguttaceae bacterium]|nr:serine/threonine protein kinase [Thermoguttaceae bacterium]
MQAPENFLPNERVETALVALRRSLATTSFSEWNRETFFRALEKATRSNKLTEAEERALVAVATEEVETDADETSPNPFEQTLCDLAFELRDAFRGETPPTLRELRRRWNESDDGDGWIDDEEKDRDTSDHAPKPGDRIYIRVELANGASTTARYVVMEKIGEGAQKRAFILSQEEIGRLLTLKQAVKSGRNVRRNFAQEAKTQGILDHPNIPTLFWADASQDGDPNEPPILIETFVPGEAWSKHSFDRASRDENLAILMKIATITAYAHRVGGVVHRDLKPANVMLGKYDEIYLCDWGFAFVAAEGALRNVAGTLAFAAPEQRRGEAVDFRADVFALGGILYKILTGVAPHEGAGKYTLTELLRRAETGEIDPIPEDAAPEELREIALKALAVDPKDRYADAGEFADALTNWRRRAKIGERFADLSLRLAVLREEFQEAERAKEKEKREIWAARLGVCVGLLNELTTLRRETDEGGGKAEENESEAETATARDRDLTLKFLNAEIAARNWLIDKTIRLQVFTTATALTNEQMVATKRRFELTGD